MKAAKFYQAIALLLISGVVCSAQARKEVYRDKYVIAEVERLPVILGNIHGEERTYLRVFGKTYKDVRGAKPYYIRIPDLHSIVFVTNEGEEHASMHIVSVETQKHASVAIGGLSFGNNIGFEQFGRKAGEPMTDYIEHISPDRFEVNTRSISWKETTSVNLKSKLIERKETTFYDADGRITKRFVDGKRTE